MIKAPRAVDSLPSLEHKGVEIICRIHYGFSTPTRGPLPAARHLYGAVSPQGERHWRNSLQAIKELIDHRFNVKKQKS
jgi:hypothetical protein